MAIGKLLGFEYVYLYAYNIYRGEAGWRITEFYYKDDASFLKENSLASEYKKLSKTKIRIGTIWKQQKLSPK